MMKLVCIKDCELNINNHIKKFIEGVEVDENLYTNTYPKFFKTIGEFHNIGHLTKIIYIKEREPTLKTKIKKKKKKIFEGIDGK